MYVTHEEENLLLLLFMIYSKQQRAFSLLIHINDKMKKRSLNHICLTFHDWSIKAFCFFLFRQAEEESPQFLHWIMPKAVHPFGFTQHIIKWTVRGRRDKGGWEASDRAEIKVPMEPRTPTRSTLMTHRKHVLLVVWPWAVNFYQPGGDGA